MDTTKQALDATTGALASAPPEAAIADVVATARLREGCAVDVQVGDRVLTVDMPEPFGGRGAAPTPGEYALAALGACQAITYRVWASRLGLPLDGVTVDVRGQVDVRGLLGVAEVVPGFGGVELRVTVDGVGSPAREEELRRAVDEHCPVLDVFERAIPVSTSLA